MVGQNTITQRVQTQQMKNNIIPSWVIYGILFIAAFLFVFLFSCTTSPLYEHHPFWFHGDSGIFQEMGVCLAQGGIPYVDLFDHKGPALWFIQALGILISPRLGIMLLQSLSLFITLILWYKSVHILTQRQTLSLLITFLGLFFVRRMEPTIYKFAYISLYFTMGNRFFIQTH